MYLTRTDGDSDVHHQDLIEENVAFIESEQNLRPLRHSRVHRWAISGIGLGMTLVIAGVLVFRQVSSAGVDDGSATRSSIQLFGFGSMFHSALKDLDHCGEKSCRACVKKDGCRWCPSDGKCHAEASILSTCHAPINSEGQCWGDKCAYQLGEFLNLRPDDAKQWVEQTLAHQDKPLLPFPTYPPGHTGIFDLATGVVLSNVSGGSPVTDYTIGLIADWGTGTCAAKVVAGLAAAKNPAMTMHMGDVYYVATPEQFDTNFVGLPRGNLEGVAFPKGHTITFTQMGNHELISGCEGLYKNGFSYTGQMTTYAVWQTDYWRFVSLDTGRLCYKMEANGDRDAAKETDAPMPEEVVDWLIHTVKLGDPNDKRGIVLLSHHQPYDAFATAYTGAAMQLNKILPKGKQLIWLFGHNHMLALYKKMTLESTDFVMYPRLIGIGGFPNILAAPKRTEGLVAYDFRTYQSEPDDDGKKQNVGFNGYANLVVSGKKLDISYITASCKNDNCIEGYDPAVSTTVAFETFEVDSATGQVDQTWMYVSDALVKVSSPSDEVPTLSCIPKSAFAEYEPSSKHYD